MPKTTQAISTPPNFLPNVAACDGQLNRAIARFEQVQSRTPQWPVYVYEEAIAWQAENPTAQALLDLQIRLDNFAMRLEALVITIDATLPES